MEELIRQNIISLKPYSSARSEFSGEAKIFLDANENWRDFVSDRNYNRYPDPLQSLLKEKIERVLSLPADHLILGNGSDELIDLLLRIFCIPGKDKVLLTAPTYGAYQVFADINDVGVSFCPLQDDFGLDMQRMRTMCSMDAKQAPEAGIHKLLFLCSPNNPTGNSFQLEQIEQIATLFRGVTVVDEAYHEFSEKASAVTLMEKCPRLVVLRTFSKSWGLASARVGMAVAPLLLVKVMNKVKYPYNVSGVAQELVSKALDHAEEVYHNVEVIKRERERVSHMLTTFSSVKHVFPSDANFLLVRVKDPDALCTSLREQGIIIRNRSSMMGCEGCVRITIGSKEENDVLLQAIAHLEERGCMSR